MTHKFIAYDAPDGLVLISPNWGNMGAGETEADFLARVLARNIETSAQIIKSGPRKGEVFNPHLTADTPVHFVDAADIPQDRSTRATWRLEGGKVKSV